MEYKVFLDPELWEPPIQRAAYSDRTALVMAELALLAYVKHGEPEGRRQLETLLNKASFDLVECYNENETQAFLAIQDVIKGEEKLPGMIVLSFRGTEPDKFKDIITDLKTGSMELDGVLVHQGFWEAFGHVKDKIWGDLKPKLDKGYTLYITGHSLGGALALFATHQIGNDSTGACYTFGSPRGAGFGFDRDIKTPIYRVVNSYDAVPTLPPEEIPFLLYKILAFFKVSKDNWIMKKLNSVHGYIHHGDMRYFSQGKHEREGGFDDVVLHANPSSFYRLLWWWQGMREYREGSYKNHEIGLYCDKLRIYAKRRNKDNVD